MSHENDPYLSLRVTSSLPSYTPRGIGYIITHSVLVRPFHFYTLVGLVRLAAMPQSTAQEISNGGTQIPGAIDQHGQSSEKLWSSATAHFPRGGVSAQYVELRGPNWIIRYVTTYGPHFHHRESHMSTPYSVVVVDLRGGPGLSTAVSASFGTGPE